MKNYSRSWCWDPSTTEYKASVFVASWNFLAYAECMVEAARDPELIFRLDDGWPISECYARLRLAFDDLWLLTLGGKEPLGGDFLDSVAALYPPGSIEIVYGDQEPERSAVSSILQQAMRYISLFNWKGVAERREFDWSRCEAHESFHAFAREWTALGTKETKAIVRRLRANPYDFEYIQRMLERERRAILGPAYDTDEIHETSAAIPQDLRYRAQLAKLNDSQREILKVLGIATQQGRGVTLRGLIHETRANSKSQVERSIKSMQELGLEIWNSQNGAGYSLNAHGLQIALELARIDAESTPKQR